MRNRDSSSRYEAMHEALHSLSHTELTPEILISTTTDKRKEYEAHLFAAGMQESKVMY